MLILMVKDLSMHLEEKQIILITCSGALSKRNVDIKKKSLNRRKRTDSNESQITRNF